MHGMNSFNSMRKITPLGWLILIVVFGIAMYMYTQGTLDHGSSLEPAPITPAAAPITPDADAKVGDQPGKFDFYVLSLSWSPDYCATSGSNDPQECSIGRKLGFVLHGLWPQYNKGYPSDCSNVRLPSEMKSKFAGLYPNTSLFDHEWDKHGTCSGLTPEQYLTLSKRIKDSVVIPDAYRSPEQPFRVTASRLASDFVSTNPQLSPSSLAAYCSGSGRFLQELDVCFSPEGKPTACSAEIQSKASKSCGSPDFLVRNVR
jgi:ribonuclease T2